MEITQTSPNQQATPAAQPSASEAESGASALSSDFETFLRMLTVQMENQDPLNPIESADFAVQLATFSGVEQQVRSNDLLERLVGQNSLSALTQVSGWVGMEARAAVAAPYDGQPVTLYPKMPEGADQATLIVRNDLGSVVSRSAIAVSDDPIAWNGTDQFGASLPFGDYSFEVEAKQDGDVIDVVPVEVYAPVTEARLKGNDAVVVFASGDESPAEDVTAVRQPQG